MQDYRTCNSARLEFPTYFFPPFDPNKWWMKNGLFGGVRIRTYNLLDVSLLPLPLDHGSSGLSFNLFIVSKNIVIFRKCQKNLIIVFPISKTYLIFDPKLWRCSFSRKSQNIKVNSGYYIRLSENSLNVLISDFRSF